MTHALYRDYLTALNKHIVHFMKILSVDHVLHTVLQSKVGLSSMDNKRWHHAASKQSLAFGHWRLGREEEEEALQ